MIPDALQAWLAMNGDARYVWPAWALALTILIGCVLHARRERRRVLGELRRRARRDDSRRNTSSRDGAGHKRSAHDPA